MKNLIIAALLLFSPLISFAADRGIVVENPYVSLAPPGVSTTGVFMTLRNTGSTNQRIIGAKSPAASIVEFHQSIIEQNIAKMRLAKSLDIPAKGVLELRSGSHHIMLVGLNRPLKEGDKIPLTLQFDDKRSYSLSVPVKRIVLPDSPTNADQKR